MVAIAVSTWAVAILVRHSDSRWQVCVADRRRRTLRLSFLNRSLVKFVFYRTLSCKAKKFHMKLYKNSTANWTGPYHVLGNKVDRQYNTYIRIDVFYTFCAIVCIMYTYCKHTICAKIRMQHYCLIKCDCVYRFNGLFKRFIYFMFL